MRRVALLVLAGCGGQPFAFGEARAVDDASFDVAEESATVDSGPGGAETASFDGGAADAPAEADGAQAKPEAGQDAGLCGTVCDWTQYPCDSGRCEPNSCNVPGDPGGRCYSGFLGGTNEPVFASCGACN
jgi:hypothetical protein